MSNSKENQTIFAYGANLTKISIPNGIEKNNENKQESCVNSDKFTYGNTQDSDTFTDIYGNKKPRLSNGWRAACELLPVPRFNGTHSYTKEILTFADFVDATINRTEQKTKARECGQAYKGQGDTSREDEYSKLKESLYWWTPSGLGTHRCLADMTPTGFITVDIDGLSPQEAVICKRAVCSIPCVFYAAYSISGCGVVAYVKASKETAANKEHIEALYGLFEVFLSDYITIKPKVTVDQKCKDYSRARVEPLDPKPYVNHNAATWDANSFEKKMHEAFNQSELARIAAFFGGGEIVPSSYQVGLTFCLLSLKSGENAQYESPFVRGSFPISAQIVGLSKSGEGKTTFNNAYLEACKSPKLDFQIIKPDSSKNFEKLLSEQANEFTEEGDEDGENNKEECKKDKKKRNKGTWRKLDSVKPCTTIEDEAAAGQDNKQKLDFKKEMEAVRRMAFDGVLIPGSSISTPLPSYPFKVNYASVRTSTIEDWAKVAATMSRTAGDARRVLEFRIPSYKEGEDTPNTKESIVGRMMGAQIAKKRRKAANVNDIIEAIEDLKPKEIKAVDLCPLESAQALLMLWDLVDEREFEACAVDMETIVATLTACEAFAHQRDKASRADWFTAWAIFCGILQTRDEIRGKQSEHAITREQDILTQLKDKINDGLRRSKYKGLMRAESLDRWINGTKGESFRKALESLQRSELLRYSANLDGKKRIVLKWATAEEAEKMIELREQTFVCAEDMALSVVVLPHVIEAFTLEREERRTGKQYADCSDDEKHTRATNYVKKALEGVSKGCRNNEGWACRCCLEAAGMFDPIGQEALAAALRALELPENEITGRNGVLRSRR